MKKTTVLALVSLAFANFLRTVAKNHQFLDQ
jgi:hypothetical protein